MVRLTARTGAANPMETLTLLRETPGMATTVLIVDDHPSFRASARRMLEADGYEVIGEADNGRAALAATLELRPELVLLDVRLPDLDGFEVARRLLAPNGPRPQIVLVSSHDSSDFGEDLELSGVRGFVAKGELSAKAITLLLG
jgi:DNA-binding NarL/FixJ family response regulator